jgi:hypothetical protein
LIVRSTLLDSPANFKRILIAWPQKVARPIVAIVIESGSMGNGVTENRRYRS